MNWEGFALVIITFTFVACEIVGHKWIKKVTNCYFFWVVIAIFCLSWLMAFRFVEDWQNLAHYWKTGESSIGDHSITISKAFLLDICPFAAFMLPILLIADPTRKAARSFAPIAFLGGFMTICSLMGDASAELTAEFIFKGTGGNKCYFIMHFFQVTLAVGVWLNTPRNGWKGYVLSAIMTVVMYSYVAICASAMHVEHHVSGLRYADWMPDGEYHLVAEILHWDPKVCPWVGIPCLVWFASTFIFIKDYVFDKGWFRYGNAHSGKWYRWYNYNKFVKQKWL